MRVAVIGGGPAGMMAAIAASESCQVILYEKNEKLGKKLYLTGKGRCNITNAREGEDFFKNIPKNPKFLYSSFSQFDNVKLVDFLESNGLKTKVEQGKRVFPQSDKASDVTRTLEKVLKENRVIIKLHTPVEDFIVEDNRISGIIAGGRKEYFDRVILATGGMSYSSTGSDGYFHRILKKYGHTITEIHPSLIPLEAEDTAFCRNIMGLSLKNVRASLMENGKTKFTDVGEMLFTHYGLSGPLILSASAHISDYSFSDTLIRLDMKPGLDEKELEDRILRDLSEYNAVTINNMMKKLLPSAMIEPVLQLSGISPDKKTSSITKAERKELVRVLKATDIKIKKTRKLEEAIITRGGVDVREVNPSTMESRILSGLYIAGELLDVDAYTGGYNLQIAFSTGYKAGTSAGK